MKRIARSTIVNKIENSGGRFFSVLFKKRTNGALRLMTCRINKENLEAAKSRNLISVIDTEVNDYRNVNIDGIVLVNIDGKSYRVR